MVSNRTINKTRILNQFRFFRISVFVMVFMQKHRPKTTYIQHFSGELKFTAIEFVVKTLIINKYNEPTQKLVEPELKKNKALISTCTPHQKEPAFYRPKRRPHRECHMKPPY